MDKKTSKNFNDRIRKGQDNKIHMKVVEEDKKVRKEESKGLRGSGEAIKGRTNANMQIKNSVNIPKHIPTRNLTGKIISSSQEPDFPEPVRKIYQPSNFAIFVNQKQKSAKPKSQNPITDPKTLYQEETKSIKPNQATKENPKNPKNPKKLVSQSVYEELALSLILDIQTTLTSKYKLSEIWLPTEEKYSQGPRCNIFISPNWSTSSNKKLILIQGAGQVRAGIWSRSVCINESLETGSMLPFIEKGLEEQYDILILNPNFTKDPATKTLIPLNSSRSEHGEYVWEKFISTTIGGLYLVAHSCGGHSVQHWVNGHWQEFKTRVKKIAYTDAVITSEKLSREKCIFMKKIARHWRASKKPGNEKLNSCNDIDEYSAGHNKHEYTSGYAFPYIFPFFQSP
ncbi:hypothetical protein SteCoe_25645 [Stentor coeruleus]|uniref:Arb2 domain-containing protein n=1 Tax=Stentor coeruleus TaxID=5963 RepID=A0A1R2BEQ1_9CILI|nr:hypothetical protein SteCoe_25645 [Stentor coeruleus]